VVHQIVEGLHPGWVEGIRERADLNHDYVYASRAHLKYREPLPASAIRWSSLGGSEEGEDCYTLGIAVLDDPQFVIPATALIELLSLLLERSGLDPEKTPALLGPFDPNAEYARLPSPPPKPPPPLNKNKHVLADMSSRIWWLARLQEKDPPAAHEKRVVLLSDMKEIGLFREDLITSRDASRMHQTDLARFLSKVEELRRYYQSAHRKTSLGISSMPNAIGGPLSYQLIDQTRSWDFGDDHPHEIYARFELLMRKLSNLEGDYGERKVEDGTFKAIFHWEREDGIHASLTKVIVESW
jgi:hypothetical protein